MKPVYIDPYQYKMSRVADEFEYGLISKRQFDIDMEKIAFMQEIGIYPFSNLELDKLSANLVQPYRKMCHIAKNKYT